MDTSTLPADGLTEMGLRTIVITVVFSFLATVAVIGRFWARYLNAITPLLEDWLVVGGLIVNWGYAAGNIVFAYNGLGVHPPDLVAAGKANQLQNQLKLLIANQVTYAIALGLVKTSILLSLKRIFNVFRAFRIIANCAMVFCICWAMQTILIAFLICRPLSYNWDQVNKSGTCGNTTVAYVSIGVVDVISDIIIFVLPMPLINGLKMRRSSRLATMAIFTLGLFTVAAGVVRTAMVLHTRFSPNDLEGPTQNLIWASVEPSVAIIVACLLVIRPLLVFARAKCSSLISRLPYGSGSAWSTRKSAKDSYILTDGTTKSKRGFTAQKNESERELKTVPGKIWQTTEVHIDGGWSRTPSGEVPHRTDVVTAV
ncbi:uncharacterized protein BDZ99DRAFT_516074 [Mytilinidion resinicola]|uniref:Rhodopsin domain-containing protein n=1 Tax=Mytilinidion resinicola TaxID=574789 RepID=A0A6A6Z2K0_9PEZI|nr:uncharacterized protein BDZ99DRAFT_516074 [Mytilinidion resinicola]KAF2815341.1 hypothetical protein BDZ99DRAFT_516074 [Mytilinidion resinicola]